MLKKFFARIIQDWHVKVLSFAMAIALFSIHQIIDTKERSITVPLSYLIDDDMIAVDKLPRSVVIHIKGPDKSGDQERSIFAIKEEDFTLRADLSGRSKGSHKVPIDISLSGTAEDIQDQITMWWEPEHITVALEERMNKSVPVKPTISGFPPLGYELSQYFVSPNLVEISGPRNVIEQIESVATEIIDISDKTEDYSLRVRIQNDGLLEFPGGGDVVEFRAVVKEAIMLQVLEEVPLIVADLQEGLTVSEGNLTGALQIQGTRLLLESLTTGDLRMMIDCSDIDRPGVYELPVKPFLPRGVVVLKYQPSVVELTIVEQSIKEEVEE